MDEVLEQTVNRNSITSGGIIGFNLHDGAFQQWIRTANLKASDRAVGNTDQSTNLPPLALTAAPSNAHAGKATYPALRHADTRATKTLHPQAPGACDTRWQWCGIGMRKSGAPMDDHRLVSDHKR